MLRVSCSREVRNLNYLIDILDKLFHPFNCFLGDNGTISMWDYNSGTAFQNLEDIPQPGSLEAEAGVFCSTFDMTGTRLITGCADKTIKVCPPFFMSCVFNHDDSSDLCRTILMTLPTTLLISQCTCIVL